MKMLDCSRLPIELWQRITVLLATRDAIALSRTSRYLYDVLIDFIYAQHIKLAPFGNAPLWWAVEKQILPTARRALAQGSDLHEHMDGLNHKINQTELPLFQAISNDDIATVKLLMEYGGNPAASGRTGNAITRAAAGDHTEILELLLASTCSSGQSSVLANLRDNRGNTPLHRARKAAVPILLKYGANLEARGQEGRTPFLNAISEGSIVLVELLLAAGADPWRVDREGSNALDIAIEHLTVDATDGPKIFAIITEAMYGMNPTEAQMHEQLVKRKGKQARVLLQLGAKADAMSTAGVTPLWVIAGEEYPGSKARMRLGPVLVDHGADINFSQPATLMTPLMRAAAAGRLDLTQLFISKGADIGARDYLGKTALHHAAENGQDVCIITLMPPSWFSSQPAWSDELQIDALTQLMRRDHEGRTALMLGLQNGHSEVVQRLLGYGAKAETADLLGRSALAIAVCKGDVESAAALVKHGASIETCDHNGRTPLMQAAFQGCLVGVKWLLDQGAQIDVINIRAKKTELQGYEEMGDGHDNSTSAGCDLHGDGPYQMEIALLLAIVRIHYDIASLLFVHEATVPDAMRERLASFMKKTGDDRMLALFFQHGMQLGEAEQLHDRET